MRPWKALLLMSLCAANCQDCQDVCCEYDDATHDIVNRGECLDAQGIVQEDVECENLGDPDVDLPDTDEPPVDETDPATDDTDAPVWDCVTFCDAILVVCPGEAECVTSCEEHATIPPSQAAVECAQQAADCPATGACWDMLGL